MTFADYMQKKSELSVGSYKQKEDIVQPTPSVGMESRLLRPVDVNNSSLDSYQMSAYPLATKSGISQVGNTTSGDI